MIEWQGFVLMVLGIFLSAIATTVNKKLLGKNVPANLIGVVNMICGGLLLLVASGLFMPPTIESWLDWPRGLLWPLIITTLFNVVIQFGNIHALKHADASLVAPISAAQPMVVLIPAMLILGEVPSATGYIGLFLIAFGTYLLAIGEQVYEEKGKPWVAPRWLAWTGEKARYFAPVQMLFRNKGVKIAFVVACSGAVAINVDKLVVLRSSSLFSAGLKFFMCGLIMLPTCLRSREYTQVSKADLPMLLVNPFIFAIYLGLFESSLYFGFASYIGALKRTQTIVVLLLAYFFLGEVKAATRWRPAVVMVLGAILLGF
ncbi:MAG: DMT family transporter [Patescibacteria group bacterium]